MLSEITDIDLVFLTHNRLDYTKLAIASVLSDPAEQFSLTIWDNASTDGTVEYFKNELNDRRIADIILSKENLDQGEVLNKIWSRSKATLLGKLDNDCLVTPGWTRILSKAHNDIDELGVVACWHFPREDFDETAAAKKICEINGHKIFRHPWTCGTGLLIKRYTFKKLGPFQTPGTTPYWLKIALAGYINGWYYPLVCQEHMDDPNSKHSRFHRMSFNEAYRDTFGFKVAGISGINEYTERRRQILRNLMYDTYDPRYYTGWRQKCSLAKYKINKLLKHANFLKCEKP